MPTKTPPAKPRRTRAKVSAVEQASLADPKFHEAVAQAKSGKVVRRARPAAAADVTYVPSSKPTAATPGLARTKPPRPRRIQLGAAVVTSADVFDVRSQKLHQQIEVAVAGTVVTIDVTPAGKKATVLVNGTKV